MTNVKYTVVPDSGDIIFYIHAVFVQKALVLFCELKQNEPI